MDPWIGVVGFKEKWEVANILKVLPENSTRKLMVGVHANLNGSIKRIFQPHPQVLNLVHFHSAEQNQTILYNQLMEIREAAGPHCHGFQLNLDWPDPKLLLKLAAQSQKTVIVLQTWTQIFDRIDHSAKTMAGRAAEYEHLVDYLLLDPNSGQKKPVDPNALALYLRALTQKKLHMGFGFASGLYPHALPSLKALVNEFPNISISPEDRLINRQGYLDLSWADDYVKQGAALFQ
ncbi:MAG: hypothetical protein Q8R34_00795 [bacterium]|nr:hypothetical protein [bacterium]